MQKIILTRKTIIAEGVETALSIGEAGIKGKILCSLGVSNIRNYEPIKGERIIIAADNDGKEAVSVNTVIKAQEELISKGAAVAIIRPLETGDFNDVLKSQGAESIRNLLEPEIIKLTAASKATELKSSLKASDDRKSQFKSIELLFSKMVNNDNNGLNNLQQQQIKALAKFGTAENIDTALQIYREKGIDSCLLYSSKICKAAIEQKIQKDLQIMKNKFDPNYNLGDKKFSDIVIYDFQGKSHLVAEDYLNAIGKDKQVMQYINQASEIGKEIKSAVKQVSKITIGYDYLEMILYYTLTKIEQADKIKLENLLSTKLNPEIGTRLMRSLAEHWQQEGKEIGILEGLQVGEAKGIQIGKAEGKAEGEYNKAVEVAKKMLAQGCNVSLISSVTGLDEAFISSLE